MTIIQIGANRGYDDITDIVNQNNIDCLILVEPFSEHNKSLQECYKHLSNYHIENIAITDNPNEESVCVYYHIFDTNHTDEFQLASFNRNHFKKIRGWAHTEKEIEDGIREKIVSSMTINQLLDKYNIKNVDLLFIDTEGYDDKIIKSIDFDSFNIKEIYYEHLHIDSNSLQIFLESKGYNVIKNVGHHGWSDKAVK